ncbi:hypothetical protein QO021_29795 (plasmid) [Pseudomonas amygdali pv. lachrymans]|uniref:hypothetical protein n=1 Tax=Pseudomonas amygdali TaxID=47877 RepID=UPI0006B893C6|nr:hypothetical protein [Pseudomonas amygdali]RMM39440.1 hypothetical protein ALQ79_200748 [Pseudomonas amygdali pv. lachrymans]WIO61281.1 hypothetical protein QO021_29795 [Pseudomonas amygdali pv. lachrymans]
MRATIKNLSAEHGGASSAQVKPTMLVAGALRTIKPALLARSAIAASYGILAALCALVSDAGIPVTIGIALGITAGVWIKAPKLFNLSR